MKPLKPTMREKKRYLFVKGKIEDVEKSILEFIGVLGMSKARPVWIKKEKNSGVLSINRESIEHVRASFSIWPEEINIVKVSGTIKGLKKNIYK